MLSENESLKFVPHALGEVCELHLLGFFCYTFKIAVLFFVLFSVVGLGYALAKFMPMPMHTKHYLHYVNLTLL